MKGLNNRGVVGISRGYRSFKLLIKLKNMKKGQKVHYIPRKNCDISEYKNGKVKSITNNGAGLFVVFHCAGEWDNYQDYTAALTPRECLKEGWV